MRRSGETGRANRQPDAAKISQPVAGARRAHHAHGRAWAVKFRKQLVSQVINSQIESWLLLDLLVEGEGEGARALQSRH